MATAQNLIYEAAELAKVKPINGSLQPANETRYLSLLNRMLKSWRNDGIDLQLNTNLAISDTVFVDDADEMGIVYNLARRIIEITGAPSNPLVFDTASTALESLRSKYMSINDMDLPRSLQSRRHYNFNKGY